MRAGVSRVMDVILRWFLSATSSLDPWLSVLSTPRFWARQISERRDIQAPVWLLAFWQPSKGLMLRFSPCIMIILLILFLGSYPHPQLCWGLPVQRSSGSPVQKRNLLFFKLRCGGMKRGQLPTSTAETAYLGLNWFFHSLWTILFSAPLHLHCQRYLVLPVPEPLEV